jgi:hypothetical protein
MAIIDKCIYLSINPLSNLFDRDFVVEQAPVLVRLTREIGGRRDGERLDSADVGIAVSCKYQ